MVDTCPNCGTELVEVLERSMWNTGSSGTGVMYCEECSHKFTDSSPDVRYSHSDVPPDWGV